MGLLDVVGPVMVGPSSSHTAGACRLARLARNTLLEAPQRVRLTLHGSFAKTARGHGTDLALVGGVLGFDPADARIRDAFEHAEEAGLEVEIATADLGDVHPNTVRLELTDARETVTVTGSSLGGGTVRVFDVNGFETRFTGAYHTLLAQHTDRPGVIARVARVIADDDRNIATLHSARRRRGGEALMAVEIDRRLAQYALDYLARVPYISWLRILPDVMHAPLPNASRRADEDDPETAAEETAGSADAPPESSEEPSA